MRIHCFIAFFCCLFLDISAQEIDISFSRNGLHMFKQLGMISSHIVDFDVLEENKIHVLYESDTKKHLLRLNKNGSNDLQFNITKSNLNNQYTIPVSISSKEDGGVLVLSNIWNGYSWMVAINGFYGDGTVNKDFGSRGTYKKKILENLDDNYGQQMYVSSKNEIIVVAKINQFNPVQDTEKIAILKISDIGRTLSSKLYDDLHFTLNCSTMNDDHLLLAYSESVNNGLERATYLVGVDSDDMIPNSLDCFTMDADYQSFDQVVFSNTEMYASHIKSDMDNVYAIRKYNASGDIDESFHTSGIMDFNVDIYNTDFVVNDKGEIFIISISLDSEYEILIKKLTNDGSIDTTFGSNGVASVFLKYPIIDLSKIQLVMKDGLYISGSMAIEGSSFGFITKLKLNVQQLKKEKLEKFLDKLFVTN